MKKISFEVNKKDKFKDALPIDDEYILLSHFIGTYSHWSDLPEVIDKLESIRSGAKTFDEVQDPNGYWSFAEGSGYLECDKETAHLISDVASISSVDLPLQELIDLLKEWKAFRGM